MENSLGIKKNIEVVGIPLVKITKIQFFSLYGQKRKDEFYGKQLYVEKIHFAPYGKKKYVSK